MKINVIDLDKTLIRYDSFRAYVFEFIKKGKAYLVFIILKRLFRFISNSEFKKDVVLYCRRQKNYEKTIITFVNMIYSDINQNIFVKIDSKSDEDTINILCSGSISDYIDPLAKKIGWRSISTVITNNSINHNHGKQKIINLQKEYPSNVYSYNFSISDSHYDLDLLKLFNNYELLN